MKQIQVLDHKTIDKIAAGEVIERPFSIVKELVENAVDAGSSAITIEIKNGGIDFIRVTDNGQGIPRDEVRDAFLRHATSKIRTVEDLFSINSLGFRGEALASIASVCQMELITKTRYELEGIHYSIEGGNEIEFKEIGAPNGSTFIARNIFYNMPVRKKFLKTEATEASYIAALVERLALSNPSISFKFINNNQTKLFTTGNDNSKEIIYHIYGRDIAKQLIMVDDEKDGIRLHGFIGKPNISRSNRNFENYYINGRYTKNKVVTQGLENAYGAYMMQHKYPFAVFFIQMDTNSLDINVHPTKMEVRFSDPQKVYECVNVIIKNALGRKEFIPSMEWDEHKKKNTGEKLPQNSLPEPFETKRIEKESTKPDKVREESDYHVDNSPLQINPIRTNPELIPGDMCQFNGKVSDVEMPKGEASIGEASYAEKSSGERSNAGVTDVEISNAEISNTEMSHVEMSYKNEEYRNTPKATIPLTKIMTDHQINTDIQIKSEAFQLNLFEDKFLSKENKKEYKIIGQVFKTYWLVEWKDTLYFMDQHAAHEKVLYEKIMKDFQNKEIMSQYVSPPLIISLTLEEEQMLIDFLDYFKELGFEIEHFGGKEYAVRAVPSNLITMNESALFMEILDALASVTKRDNPESIMEKIASMACKGAVKGNQTLSASETIELFDQLFTLDNPYYCPHGRPTLISMTKNELEKKFKRVL